MIGAPPVLLGAVQEIVAVVSDVADARTPVGAPGVGAMGVTSPVGSLEAPVPPALTAATLPYRLDFDLGGVPAERLTLVHNGVDTEVFAPAAGVLTWMATERWRSGKPSMLGGASSAVAGLVAGDRGERAYG